MENNKFLKSFEGHLEERYGKPGTDTREVFDQKSKSFMIGELLKEERKKANMTQDDLAKRAGTKKSYISRLENGKIDIQISTLFKIFEEGLGKRINLIIL